MAALPLAPRGQDWGEAPDVCAFHGRGRELEALTAWVLAAERTARPFALRLPGGRLPLGQGREQRRLALTALALLPGEGA